MMIFSIGETTSYMCASARVNLPDRDDHMTLTILHQAEHFSLSVHQPTHHQTREKIPPTHRDSLDIPTALFWIFGRTLVLCLDRICAWIGLPAWTEFVLGRNLCLDGIGRNLCLDW